MLSKIFYFLPLFMVVPQIAAASTGSWSSHEVLTDAGVLEYQVYLPDQGTAQNSVDDGNTHYNGAILGLHGCHETAMDFAGIARLAALADREGLVLVLPEQSPLLNSDRCWNWFLPVNQTRLGGEPEQFMMALQAQLDNLPISRDKVFVLGISAGAIMANVMGSCYPEVFAGVAIHSGIQVGEPLKPQDAVDGHMRCPIEDSATAGNLAFSCSGLMPRKLPRVLLFHGDADQRVYPCNEDATLAQWVQMADWSDDLTINGSVSLKDAVTTEVDSAQGGDPYTMTDLITPNWRVREVLVHGMAHAWSGGPSNMPNSDPLGPDATQMIWDFFQAP